MLVNIMQWHKDIRIFNARLYLRHKSNAHQLLKPLLYTMPINDNLNHEISNNSEKFLINITTCDPHIVILLGDFNAKSKSWSVNDTTTGKGTILKNLKVVFTTFLLVCFLSLNKSTCQTRKNTFYFT